MNCIIDIGIDLIPEISPDIFHGVLLLIILIAFYFHYYPCRNSTCFPDTITDIAKDLISYVSIVGVGPTDFIIETSIYFSIYFMSNISMGVSINININKFHSFLPLMVV